LAMQSGIMTRVYKPGSIIYFENDKSEYIYILKSGRVLLTYTKIDTGEEVKEEVRQGEFFGVKSALGKYPREETAQTIGETTVLVLGMADFESLILRNVNIVRKMLRVFSNQLRRIGRTVRTVLGESDNVNPDLELFRIGEHYYKAGDFAKSSYAFKKYMEYYPDTDNAKIAMERIRTVGAGGPAPSKNQSSDEFDFSMDSGNEEPLFEFSDDDSVLPELNGNGSSGGSPSMSSEFSSEMDDFLADDLDDFSGDIDDFSFGDDSPKTSVKTPEEELSAADRSLDSGNYDTALEIYTGINDRPGSVSDAIAARAEYGAGVCLFEMRKYKDAMGHFSKIMKDFQKSDKMKGTLYHIGMIFEAAGQKDKAIAYYNKVLNMTPKDGINSKALDKIKSLQRG